MFTRLIARLGGAIRTKVGIALIGALVVGGGGTVMAMATAQGQPRSNLVAPRTSASPTAHSDDSSSATKVAEKDDQDCTGSATGAIASPTAHSDDSSNATKAAGKDDQEANENESAQDEQNENETECKSGESPEATERPEGTHTPEATERPEGTHTPEATKGAGGD